MVESAQEGVHRFCANSAPPQTRDTGASVDSGIFRAPVTTEGLCHSINQYEKQASLCLPRQTVLFPTWRSVHTLTSTCNVVCHTGSHPLVSPGPPVLEDVMILCKTMHRDGKHNQSPSRTLPTLSKPWLSAYQRDMYSDTKSHSPGSINLQQLERRIRGIEGNINQGAMKPLP
jgi:hypothetical protein